MAEMVHPVRTRVEGVDIKSKLIMACKNPRDKAFISILSETGISLSQLIRLSEDSINYEKKALTVVQIKKRLKLKCSNCGRALTRMCRFCPGCGIKVKRTASEIIESPMKRVINIDRNTLRLLKDYLRWRQKFSYNGSLLFPFSRQRASQILQACYRRAKSSDGH